LLALDFWDSIDRTVVKDGKIAFVGVVSAQEK
jgi:hypothetical protein